MKKLFALLLALLLVFGLVACGGGGGSRSNTPIQDYLDVEGDEIQEAFEMLLPLLNLGDGSRFAVRANDEENELIFAFYLGEFEPVGLNDNNMGRANAALSILSPILAEEAEEIRAEIGVDSLRLMISVLTPEGGGVMSAPIDVPEA